MKAIKISKTMGCIYLLIQEVETHILKITIRLEIAKNKKKTLFLKHLKVKFQEEIHKIPIVSTVFQIVIPQETNYLPLKTNRI